MRHASNEEEEALKKTFNVINMQINSRTLQLNVQVSISRAGRVKEQCDAVVTVRRGK